MTLLISTRADWGWDPATPVRRDVTPLGVTWHYPGPGRFRFATHDGCLAQVRAWDKQHRARGSNGLEYCWLVCQHGYFIEARSTWDRMIARPGSNGTAAANSIRVTGQFMAGTLDAPPSDQELRWMGEATARARSQSAGYIVDGHRDHYATACPGDAIYRALPTISRYASAPPAPVEPTPGGELDATERLRLDQAWDSVTPGKEGEKAAGALFTAVLDLAGKIDAQATALADLAGKIDALSVPPAPVEPPPFA